MFQTFINWLIALKIWLVDERKLWRFPIFCWLVSRGLILLAFFVIAPLLDSEVAVGSYAFIGGDGEWYLRIAAEGYTLDADGALRSPAFFPLYPLLIRLLTIFHLSPEISGILINNTAFLGATLLLYSWLKSQHNHQVALWGTAVFTFCPFSLFGTVLYTEGLFLLLTMIALKAFTEKRLGLMAISGILATATRPPGILLIPALLIQAWRERRSPLTFIAVISIGSGLLSYSIYCWLQFNDPLAFSHAQAYWTRQLGDLRPWLKIFLMTVAGDTNYNAGELVRIDHPLSVLLVFGASLGTYFRRHDFGRFTPYWTFIIICICWIVGDYGFLRLGAVFGGLLLLWHTRSQLAGVVTLYGFCSLGLLLISGSHLSADRLSYGIISLTIAAGVALAKHPLVGYGLLPLSAIILITIATQLGQGILVA